MIDFVVVIPARYASERLPGKPLRLIAGKPLVQHVFERAVESAAKEIIVATDDPRIEQAATGFGATVCMTAIIGPARTGSRKSAAYGTGRSIGWWSTCRAMSR
jgi:CMP-2-keto-3-deoxyoctulosonic acid synthetase